MIGTTYKLWWAATGGDLEGDPVATGTDATYAGPGNTGIQCGSPDSVVNTIHHFTVREI